MKSLTILGSGSWGTALAQTFSQKLDKVYIWGIEKDVINEINSQKTNSKYIPNIILNENIEALLDLEKAISLSNTIVIAIPTQAIRSVLQKIGDKLKDKIVISASKGIEIDTLKLISDIVLETTNVSEDNLFALSGPSFAKEVAMGLPTAITLAGKNLKKAEELQRELTTDNFRLYITDDIIGAEIGGAVKNVIAIATGVSDGLGLGNNARASLITRGLYEMKNIVKVYGGKPQTLYGLSGLGDLVLTATGNLSRNRTFGYLLGKGLSVEQALKEVNQVVEGAKTAKAIKKLAEKHNLELPISEAVYKVIYENLPIKEAVKLLLSRDLKREDLD
jgi:glycerol-3-phosphate dehydrogenase (NAD(P)+)